MTTQAPDTAGEELREQWLGRVSQLIDQITAWAQNQGWSIHRDLKVIEERRLGTYSVPTLRIRMPQGEVHVNPVARHVMGADGRVDLEAWPSLNRVRLVPAADQWKVITDSNVPLTDPWGDDLFVQLAKDLWERVGDKGKKSSQRDRADINFYMPIDYDRYTLALMALFGLVRIEQGPPIQGRPWIPVSSHRTAFGAAVMSVLQAMSTTSSLLQSEQTVHQLYRKEGPFRAPSPTAFGRV